MSKRVGLVLALIAAVFAVFAQALSADFVSWDDDKNFLANVRYRGLSLDHVESLVAGTAVSNSDVQLGADPSTGNRICAFDAASGTIVAPASP